jgi:hypothetical protein
METSPSPSICPKNCGPTLGLAALVILLAWQLLLSFEARSALARSAKQLEPAVGQSQQVQGSAMKLLDDLIVLADKNTNAKAVVQKYGIQRNAAAGTPAEKK